MLDDRYKEDSAARIHVAEIEKEVRISENEARIHIAEIDKEVRIMKKGAKIHIAEIQRDVDLCNGQDHNRWIKDTAKLVEKAAH